MSGDRGKYIADLRAALGRQTLRADKAEQQVRGLAVEVERLKRQLAEQVSK